VNVDFGVAHFPELVDGVAAVHVEQRDERLEHVQMERGRDQFPVRPPFVTCGATTGRLLIVDRRIAVATLTRANQQSVS